MHTPSLLVSVDIREVLAHLFQVAVATRQLLALWEKVVWEVVDLQAHSVALMEGEMAGVVGAVWEVVERVATQETAVLVEVRAAAVAEAEEQALGGR